VHYAYCTNGLAHHRPPQACELLADLGYRGVALTPDVGGLDPLAPDPRTMADVRQVCRDRGLSLVVETGARYALDARRKHHPSLMDASAAGRGLRLDYYRRCLDLAVALGAPVLSLWSGSHPDGLHAEDPAPTSAHAEAWERLTGEMAKVLAMAAERGVVLAFEPEPGMWIERPAGYAALLERLGTTPAPLRLTLDLGHCVVTGDLPIAATITAWRAHLAHVQVDDARPLVHEHLPLGAGELDLKSALSALRSIHYTGQVAVELARDSHRGPEMAARSLKALLDAG
jgi:sugar phosphate isomerase/epimerase